MMLLSGVSMKNKFMAYLRDESGQTSTEYILLVAVAAAIVIKFKDKIDEKLLGENGILGRVMSKTTDKIESDLFQ